MKILNDLHLKFHEIVILCICVVFVFILFARFLPPSIDWIVYYKPAAIKLIHGNNPYDVLAFLNPPWILLPMLPLLLLPDNIVHAFIAMATLITVVFVSYKMGVKFPGIVILLLSPPLIQSFMDGNIDWIVTIGFILPPQIGLFFVSLKPQMGIAIALFWLIDSWREGGIRKVLFVFAPFSIALGLSFILYGFYPLNFLPAIGRGGNISFWPASLPLGLGLIVYAIRKRDINYSIIASPCLSPYVLLHSMIGVLMVIARSVPEILATVIGLWILVTIQF